MKKSFHNKRESCICAISANEGALFATKSEKYINSDDVIDFVKQIQRKNPGKKLALYWDNASHHTANNVEEHFAKHSDKLKSILTVPY